ncbi:MAG: M48 family metalloprotease [Proteobacteria bacterium]|nr:M48 family metalloprotease [Pseudomonadota bacterium]
MIKGRRRFWTAVLLTIFCVFHSNPSSGLTVNEENEISREFMTYIFTNYELVTDPEIASYIQRIGDRILANYPPQPFKYQFYVIKNDTYNAFAGPGAQIFIHTGLFEALDTEDQLAGIIGHEISHSVCRHISENIARSGKIGLGTLAGVAAGIFMSIYGDPAAGSALTVGSIAGSQSVALSYSRDDELQADQMGLQFLTKAGYSAKGLIEALNIIRSKQWYGKEQIPAYLTTHPALEDRIGFIKNWMDGHPEKQIPKEPASDFGFNLIHTKVLALYGDINAAKAQFNGILEKDPDNLFGLYGMGLVLARSGKMDEAIVNLKKALEKRAFNVVLLKTLGEVYFNTGRYANAQNVFEGALSLVPRDYECNLYLGRIMAESGKYEQAIGLLLPFANEEKGKTWAYYYLGDIYARQGEMMESYYHLGLYYRNKKDVKNALIQFERAFKLAEKPEMKEKIKANIDELKGQGKKDKKKEEQGKSLLFE